MVAVGDVLVDKYRVERELGRGGMGLVVAARHVALDELVAIKMVLPEHVQNEEVVRRFMREARAAAKIRSEHVVKVSDVGRLPSGEPYMIMEMLRGEDLDSVVRKGALPLTDAVDFVMQALEAVAEAHAAGIVHRDLKPANLFLTRRRDGSACVKVLDFGISKLSSSDMTAGAAMTRTQGLLGSPLYMSPEQLESARDVDHRADLWSFGVILHQLLSSQFPFNAETLPQLVAKVLSQAPTPLRLVRSDLPEVVGQIISRCLERDRTKRPQSAQELAAWLAPLGSASSQSSLLAIENVARGSGAVVIRPERLSKPEEVVGVSPTVVAGPSHQSTFAPLGGTRDATPAPERRKPPMLIIAAVGAVAAIGIGVVALRSSHRPENAAANASPPVPTSVSTASTITTTSAPAAIASTTAPSPVASPAPAAPVVSASVTATKTSAPKLHPTASASVVSAAPPAAPAKPACDPPYTFDEKGNKKFKAECL